MPIIINGTSGITGPDGSNTTPAVRGTDSDTGFTFAAGQITASLNGTPANVPLVSGTAKDWNWNGLSTNASIDFTGIPSWAKRVTVMFSGVSTSATSFLQVQIGSSGGIENSGYGGTSQYFGTGAAAVNYTSGAVLHNAAPAGANLASGSVQIQNISGNTWCITGGVGMSNTAYSGIVFYSKTLSGTLDRVRITTTGADTFDAGTINIMYE